MRNIFTLFVLLLSMFLLVGCMEELPPETLALQQQYDDYRTNEFSDFDHFVTYMNTFSLETSHAGVYIEASYSVNPLTRVSHESMGVIIHEDQNYYYAVTDSHLFDDGERNYRITVTDTYNHVIIGQRIAIDKILEIALIKFTKPAKALYVLEAAHALPINQEPVLLLSSLGQIRQHVSLGNLIYDGNVLGVTVDLPLDDGIVGGAVFDVNLRLVGMIVSEDGLKMATYSDIWTLLE